MDLFGRPSEPAFSFAHPWFFATVVRCELNFDTVWRRQMKVSNRLKVVILALLCILLCMIVGVVYFLYQEQRQLKHDLEHMQAAKLETSIDVASAPAAPSFSGKPEQWRSVQEKVNDAVVQVFAQIAQYDILQPYKTPAQGASSGSGFFINEDGYLITNAHVVDQTTAVWIHVPSLGQRIIDVSIVGVSPERDLALLKVKDADLAFIKEQLGSVPHLELGDSDQIRRSDEVMALGYPLGQKSLKSTTGVISGREHHYIQMSAAINPGNSGGPLVNTNGEVVGVNAAGIVEAQNIGYIIPINDLKIILPDLYKVALLRKPFLGVLFNNASTALTEYLGNPQPGGCYVVEVVQNSTLAKAGVQPGDMIYKINGHDIDIYGEMTVPWSEDKISIVDYVGRISIGEEIKMVVYREGKRHDLSVEFGHGGLPPIRRVYPAYEELDYEVGFGMVVMELTANHIQALGNQAPGLAKFAEMKQQEQSKLVITNIFANSQLYRTRSVPAGSTINEVNGMKVSTLKEYRDAIKAGAHEKFFTMRVSDNVARASDNIFVALPMEVAIQEETKLARDFKYPMTETMKLMVADVQARNPIKTDVLKAPTQKTLTA